ncbi:MAG: serine/threonine-protein kinase, partial [Planctomycetota bacterium]
MQRDPLEDLETTRSLSPPATGAVAKIANRYLLGPLLGRGGFGEVYQARDEILNRDVAVKILMPAPVASDLLREARVVAALDHPSIVPVYDAGLYQERCWIAMRLVKGPSLATVLRENGPLPPVVVIQILKSMASALQHAHRHRLVHRDVKPSNILIETEENVERRAWLMDFGLAKIQRSLESSEQSRFAGTPAYMAPEQITGRRIDAKTDLYSLGCVAMEMLTGTRAFAGDSYQQVMHQI